MIRSSFCVVLCGEVVNVHLRNISNSTEPREKKIHGRTTRVATPYICSYPGPILCAFLFQLCFFQTPQSEEAAIIRQEGALTLRVAFLLY
jgi:hypothetical protein